MLVEANKKIFFSYILAGYLYREEKRQNKTKNVLKR